MTGSLSEYFHIFGIVCFGGMYSGEKWVTMGGHLVTC